MKIHFCMIGIAAVMTAFAHIDTRVLPPAKMDVLVVRGCSAGNKADKKAAEFAKYLAATAHRCRFFGRKEIQIVQNSNLFPKGSGNGYGRDAYTRFGEFRKLLRHIRSDLRRGEWGSLGECSNLQFDIGANIARYRKHAREFDV